MSNIDRHPECHMRTALGNCDPIGGFCTSVNESICEALQKVSRPQGEWIVNVSDYKSVCSVCGANETDFIYGTEMWYGLGESKFCPNCGARMKGADDE